MRLRTDLFHHVKLPDDVGVVLTFQLLVGERAVVLPVAEALRVERNQLGAVGNIIESVAFDERRRADSLIGPVVDATRSELVRNCLPEEFSIRFAERHQDAFVARDLGIAQAFVVRADVDLAAGDDRIAVSL